MAHRTETQCQRDAEASAISKITTHAFTLEAWVVRFVLVAGQADDCRVDLDRETVKLGELVVGAREEERAVESGRNTWSVSKEAATNHKCCTHSITSTPSSGWIAAGLVELLPTFGPNPSSPYSAP